MANGKLMAMAPRLADFVSLFLAKAMIETDKEVLTEAEDIIRILSDQGKRKRVEEGTKCQLCGKEGKDVERRRQLTAYPEDEFNWATLCAVCQEETDDYWIELWNEYYAGIR